MDLTSPDRRWRVVSMCDVSACPEVLHPLREIAEVLELPAQVDLLREALPRADAYLASLNVRCDREILSRAPNLRVIATPSTGLDHIDLDAAAANGTEVVSLRDDIDFLRGLTATAELAWTLLLCVARRIPSAVAAARQGDWARDRFRGTQLSGKTLGILGYGRLGRIVAEYALGFRMRVLAFDIRDVIPDPGVEVVSWERLLAEADVLTIHVHLTEQTRGMIGAPEFARMKPSAILINTSRGAVIQEKALLAALKEERLAGAGLDVIDGEWSSDIASHPLIAFSRSSDHLVITPHIGGITRESQRAAFSRTVEKLITGLSRTGVPAAR